MAQEAEESAKVWQIQSLQERQTAQERVIERLDGRISDYSKNQVTTAQLEERIKSLTSSFEDKLSAKAQRHEADVREINLKYGPLADNYKWITRGVVMLILAQVVALFFNFTGSK